MADAVTATTLNDGIVNYVVHLTNVSDGSGEAAVVKVDVSALTPPANEVSIRKVIYSTQGMAVNLYFDATADVLALALPADHEGTLDFCDIGGIKNTAGAGKTGDILLTTVGHTAGDTYSITLHCRKS